MKTFESKFYRKHGVNLPKIKTDEALYGSLRARPRRDYFSWFFQWVKKVFRTLIPFDQKNSVAKKRNRAPVNDSKVLSYRKAHMQNYGFHRKAMR